MYPTLLGVLEYFIIKFINELHYSTSRTKFFFEVFVHFNVFLVGSYRSFSISTYFSNYIFLGIDVILKCKLISFCHKLSFLPQAGFLLGIQVGTFFPKQNLHVNRENSLF